jgi:multiple sugar transport system permease protein
VGSIAFLFLPMGMSLWYSFTDYPLLKPPVYVGLSNYTQLGSDPRLRLTVWNTAVYAAAAIPLSTVFALVLAGLLGSRGLRFSRLFRSIVFIPTLVPLVATAMIWNWLLNGRYGLVNALLGKVGVQGPNWLQDDHWAIPSLVLTSLWGVGQAVVVYAAALQEVPRHLYEAAELDGMGPVRRFWSVTLPTISPVILFNVITLTIGTLQVFAVPYILFRNERGQRAAGDFYNLYLYDQAFVYQNMGYASAMAWVQLLVVFALTAAMFLASRRLVHYRAG